MNHVRWVFGTAIGVGISLANLSGFAQSRGTTVPDAQVESDVLKALAGNPRLADQTISSNTVYGTVTLSGNVRDEESRKLAENIVARTPGVQKVIDELTLASDTSSAAQSRPAPPSTSEATPAPEQNANPETPGQSGTAQPYPNQQPYQNQQPYPNQQQETEQQAPQQPSQDSPQQQPYGQQIPGQPQPQVQAQPGPYNQGQPGPYNQGPYNQGPYNQGQQGPYNQGQQPPYSPAQQGPYGQQGPYNQSQQPPYGPPSRAPYGQPSYPQQQPYPAQGQYPPAYGPPGAPAAYGGQPGGQPVNVPAGAMLRARINRGLDSNHAQPGTVFDATVLNDVVADGFVAIPRGATVQGTVVNVEHSGALKGRGELALQLTAVTLAGRTYPIASDVWSGVGGDKSKQTVNSALGLGAVGAIIGGVAGGGAGAAIGAGVGGAAGVGASAASGGGQAYIPSEAILTFHLAQPASLFTISQAEMDRLGYGVPAGGQMRTRYVRPVPYGYPVVYPVYGYPYGYRYPYRYRYPY